MSQAFHQDRGNAEFIIRCQQLAPPRIRALMQAEEDYLRALPESAESLLDVGCGSGRILEALAGRTPRLAGLDLVWANVAWCIQRVPRADVVQGDALRMPFPDAAFAVSTVMINTLGNFGDAQVPLLKEMRRVSRVVVAGCYSLDAAEAQREWYAILHAHGILGAVDEARSTLYRCVTTDGYVSERFDEQRARDLLAAAGLGAAVERPIPELLLIRATAGPRRSPDGPPTLP